MKVLTTTQRTPEWVQARLGRLTASCAADMLTRIKSGEAAARRNLRTRLVLERLTGRPMESRPPTDAMQAGIDREDAARERYAQLSGYTVETAGFVAHDTLMAGCSPDGVINNYEGLAEIKCPTPAIHLSYLTKGTIPVDYLRQVVHQLWITGAAWCDWVSYQPDFPERLQIKVLRVVRDLAELSAYDAEARMFLDEVDQEYAMVEGLSI